MQYDIISCGVEDDYDNEYPIQYTLGMLLNVLEYSTANSVRFVGTSLTIGNLCSWRGSYDIPCLTYEEDYKSPQELYNQIKNSLKDIHYGYKGGEYLYSECDRFYVAERGCSEEFAVVDTYEEDGVLYLCTKIIPY